MLHKIIDFTQTILGTVALTGIIAFSVITVSALNPSVRSTPIDEPKVAGLSTLPQENNSLPIQFTDSVNDTTVKGNISYISDSKTTYKLHLDSLTNVKELEFLNAENLNHFQTSFNISMFIPQEILDKLDVQILDNVDTFDIGTTPVNIKMLSIQQKTLKLRLSSKVNINFPFDLEFEINQ